MKSQSLQELVKKIFADEETRSEFQKNPESVLSRFNLSETDKKAMLSTHAKFGLVTGNSSQMEAALRASSSWMAPAP